MSAAMTTTTTANMMKEGKKNMCVLLWFHCFAPKLTWNQLKFTAGWMKKKDSAFWIASVVLFLFLFFFHLSLAFSFARLCLPCICDGFIEADLFRTYMERWNTYAHMRFYCIRACNVKAFVLVGVSTLPCLRVVDSFCYFSRSISLLSFLLLVGFCGCRCCRCSINAALLLLRWCWCFVFVPLAHTNIISHTQTASQCIWCVLLKHILYLFKGIQCGTHFISFNSIQFSNWVWHCAVGAVVAATA